MIKEFDHVRIKKTGVTGIVVDISNAQGRGGLYIVESDEKGVPGGWWRQIRIRGICLTALLTNWKKLEDKPWMISRL